MLLWDIDDARKFFRSMEGTFIGVGINAFSRLVPSYFIPSYEILSLRHTRDLPALRERCPVFCLEESVGKSLLHYKTSFELLSHSDTRTYLKSRQGPLFLLIYQNYPELVDLSKIEDWNLLANPPGLRIKLGDRDYFSQMAKKLGLRTIPGAIYPLGKLLANHYDHWKESLGPFFVCQLPDITIGGGKGTFFVRSSIDYERLRERLAHKRWRGKKLHRISMHKYIDGIPTSVAICITKHGVLLGPVQMQLVDLPYINGLEEKGIFCGHYWSARLWSERQQVEAEKFSMIIGEHLGSMGYRGILGIDYIMDSSGQACFFQEINPRFTGAFPFLSLIHLKKGLVPMEVFHILEFLSVSYKVKVRELNQIYKNTDLEAGHVLIFRVHGSPKNSNNLSPGVYEADTEKMKMTYRGKGFEYSAIRADNQVVITGGPPISLQNGLENDPLSRVCHVMFKNRLFSPGKNVITEIDKLAKTVHGNIFPVQTA